MQIVAEHLGQESIRRNDPAEIDLFGRSAFNRYYYATYWIARQTLVKIDPKWSDLGHKNAPEILEGQVRKRIRRELRKGLLSGKETEVLRTRASTSISEFAGILKRAYLIRVKADYRPDTPATRQGSVVQLDNTKLGDASSWPKRASRFAGAILDVCGKLGLI